VNSSATIAAALASAALASAGLAAQQADFSQYKSPWKTPWTYADGPRGPERWSTLDPDYAPCNSGKAQSPVDIRDAVPASLAPLRFDYHRRPVGYVINNGAAIRVDYHDPPGAGDALEVGARRYQLTQFHFHRPSEELIDGRRYDMVLHLMHKAADGEVAGVAVLIVAGHANANVQRLWEHMPAHEGQIAVPGLELDPADLLPVNRGYYEYSGSQTAPPCTEGVRWFVLKTPIELSAAQIAAYARIYPHDVRPPQPLNGRSIRASE
jgi:carbonic anhydrase